MKRVLIGISILLLAVLMTACGEKKENKKEEPKPCTDLTDLSAWFGLSEGEYKLIMDGRVQEKPAVTVDGHLYFPVSVLSKYDDRLYWNEAEEQLLIATDRTVYTFWPDQQHFRVDEEMIETAGYANLILRDGEPYLAEEAQFTDISYEKKEEQPGCRVIMCYSNNATVTGYEAPKGAILRVGFSDQQEIVKAYESSVRLYLAGEQEGGWAYVSTEDGMFGYVCIDTTEGVTEWKGNTNDRNRTFAGVDSKTYSHITLPEEIVMVWHQVFAAQDGNDLRKALEGTSGVNVVSPTWFSIIDTNGDISSLANASYVEEAHAKGIQVWALVNDFTKGVPGIELLSNTEARGALIQNLLREVNGVGADGINIDFEYITDASAPHYLQFLRELGIECRKAGLVLSVDNYHPVYGDSHYRIGRQSDIVDYVILMAYDEHTGNSEEAGPVASLPYLKRGWDAISERVDAKRVIVGVPFYTRRWSTFSDEGGKMMSCEALGMNSAKNYGDEHGANWQWDDELGLFYGEFPEEDGALGQIWLEDVQSMGLKVEMIRSFGVGGTAAWKLGMESADVWKLWE